jgi:flagellar P-ring protein precursor FlgI
MSILFYNLTAETIKDISNVVGIRTNQLLGYGLVVGLQGTGDKSNFTMQSLKNLLINSYVKVEKISSKNIATVMVTASLPPFARQGDTIRVKVSSIGDAKSLKGGELLITQLKGVDGRVYALAQGDIMLNTKNKTTGIIYNGATIENEIPFDLSQETSITLSLVKADANLAFLVESKINSVFPNSATAKDIKTIKVTKPSKMSMIAFLAKIQSIPISSGIKKKIIIDVSKGMVVVGADIAIAPVIITKDNFSLRIKQKDTQNKNGINIGDNVNIRDTDDRKATKAKKSVVVPMNSLVNTKDAPTISDLIRAMKMMNLSVEDIIDTLKMVKDLGAIDVEIEIQGYNKRGTNG